MCWQEAESRNKIRKIFCWLNFKDLVMGRSACPNEDEKCDLALMKCGNKNDGVSSTETDPNSLALTGSE